VRFCEALSKLVGREVRLPREAEWEYACRAETTTRYWSGDKEEDLARVGWYSDNSSAKLHPVGEKPANPWGLHDMDGNVWEWCYDEWVGSYEGREAGVEVDPAQPPPAGSPGARRVVRGDSRILRAAYRVRYHPADRHFFLGFRVVLRPFSDP